MKLFVSIALVAALVGLSTANRVLTNVYPCPHSGTTRLAHASSCSQFVQCVNGVAVEEECADGLFFSAQSQQCTTPQLANCGVERKPCPAWTDPADLVYLTDGRNCNNYFLCFDGQPQSMQCASGLTFNSNTNKCDAQQCSVTHWSCSWSENAVYSDDSDCSRFYHCLDGVQYGGQCREGLLFDTYSGRCVDPKHATCGVFTTTAATSGSTVSCAPTCTTPSFQTSTGTTPTIGSSTSGGTTRTTPTTTTTQKTTTTHTHSTSTTTKKPETTTTQKTTTTKKPETTTTQKTTTTKKPETTTTQKTTTHTHHTTTTTKKPATTTTHKTTSTTVVPELNLDSYCKTSKVGMVAVVAHPLRCDWYITCTFGHGTVGKCGSYQIFSAKKERCVLGSATTCKVSDEVDEDASDEHVFAVEPVMD